MDYMLEIDLLNESSQIQMGNYLLEATGIQIISEGINKESVKKFFTGILEFIQKQISRFKEWVAKVTKPLRDRLNKSYNNLLSKRLDNNINIPFDYEIKEIYPDYYNEALSEADEIYSGTIYKANSIKQNLANYLKDASALNVDYWVNQHPKLYQSNEDFKFAKDMKGTYEFYITTKIKAINKETIQTVKTSKNNLDKIISSLDRQMIQAAKILQEFKDDISRMENQMNNGDNNPGSANVLKAYNMLAKSMSLGGSLMYSLKNVAVVGVNEYVKFIDTINVKLSRKENFDIGDKEETNKGTAQGQAATA